MATIITIRNASQVACCGIRELHMMACALPQPINMERDVITIADAALLIGWNWWLRTDTVDPVMRMAVTVHFYDAVADAIQQAAEQLEEGSTELPYVMLLLADSRLAYTTIDGKRSGAFDVINGGDAKYEPPHTITGTSYNFTNALRQLHTVAHNTTRTSR